MKSDSRFRMTTIDKFTSTFAPRWTLNRVRARAALDMTVRHYEAAQGGFRTKRWTRNRGDVNSITAIAGSELRAHARDLLRNNAWARRGRNVVANNTVGWGIVPKAAGPDADQNAAAMALWKAWAETTQCDAEGRRTFYGLQALAMKTVFEAGEVLIRKRPRRPSDGLAIPLQLQVLEPDFLDTSYDLDKSQSGGPIVQGVEFDSLGRRAAYWLFPQHPGSKLSSGESRRIPASEVLHIFNPDRPGQVRGVSWLAASIVNLKDLDEYEDAELLKQKIAACFAAFVTDDGQGEPIVEEDEEDDSIEKLEPATVNYLKPGQQVQFGNPPNVTNDSFRTSNLRKIAAGIGVTYEDLTGDYSNVNFSSARMGRLAHWANVYDWQFHMLIPQFCDGAWDWAMEAATLAGELKDPMRADWTAPPMPMVEPDKEGLAYQRLVRNGVMTPSDVVRERGGDPEAHWNEYAEDIVRFKELDIWLDCDVSRVSAAGLTQQRAGIGGEEGSSPAKEDRSLDHDIDIDVAEFGL